MVTVELFYSPFCHYCPTAKRYLVELIRGREDTFRLKEINIMHPLGGLKAVRMGVASTPAIAINGEIVFRDLPNKRELEKALRKAAGEDGK